MKPQQMSHGAQERTSPNTCLPQSTGGLVLVMTTGTILSVVLGNGASVTTALQVSSRDLRRGVCSAHHSPVNEAPHCGDSRKGTKDGPNCHTECSYIMLVGCNQHFQKRKRTENNSVRHTEREFCLVKLTDALKVLVHTHCTCVLDGVGRGGDFLTWTADKRVGNK